MTRVLMPILAAMVAGACSDGIPIAPSPPVDPAPVVSTPAPQLQPLHITGRVVDSSDKGVPDATITQWDRPNTATSGPDGRFEMDLAVKPNDRWFWVTVEKPGYERSELAREVSGADVTSLRLHQPLNIAAGDSIHLAIHPDDPACGYHWGYICRYVRVNTVDAGLLTVELTNAAPDVTVSLASSGSVVSFEKRRTIPVSGGTTIAFEIQTGPTPVEFTLSTSLTPKP